jgi:hypothetical protein
MVANINTMGAAAGVIMATIITAHMTQVRRTSVTPQACMWGIAMAIAISPWGICQAKARR